MTNSRAVAKKKLDGEMLPSRSGILAEAINTMEMQ